MKRRDLERELEACPPFPKPNPDLEQYRTPAKIAAEFLWAAWVEGDLEGKHVVDLGCGTGVLSKGATMLGAQVTGVDVDPDALAIAATQAPTATFTEADIAEWSADGVDTIVMNPPFGAQRRNRNADRTFLDACFRSQAAAIWLLAPTVSERFLAAYAKENGYTAERVVDWAYPLEATMDHHREAVRTIPVGGYRLGRN